MGISKKACCFGYYLILKPIVDILSDELAVIIAPVTIVGNLSFCIAFASENEEEHMLKELLRPPSEADYDVSYANYVNITAVENMSVQCRSA